MAQSSLQEQLVKYITDAHALEQSTLKQVDTWIDATRDPEMLEGLQRRKEGEARHAQLLEERLRAHGAEPSSLKDTGAGLGAAAKGLLDRARPDDVGKVNRDGYVAAHLEIAAAELLSRVAERAGDAATADVAGQIKQDAQDVADKIASTWDRVVELSLAEEGVTP